MVHSPALLLAAGAVAFEHDAVARLHRTFKPNLHPVARDASHLAQQHAALRGTQARNQPFVIAALEPTGRKATRERQFHLFHVARRDAGRAAGQRGVQRPAVVPRDVGHVLGRLQAALDLERGNTGIEQLGQQRVGGQILRTEQVFDARIQVHVFPVADHFVRQPASLRALASVRASAAQRFTGQALARVGHAQSAVDEHLQRQTGMRPDLADLVDRQLAGQHHALHAQLLGHPDALRAGQRHLRAGVDLQIRTDSPDQSNQPQILHQNGIQPRLGDRPHRLLDHRQFVGKSQDVQRHIAPQTAAVQQPNHFRQLFEREVRRAVAGIQADLEAEINRVGPVLDRRAHGVHVPGRGEQFDRSTSTPQRLGRSAHNDSSPRLSTARPPRHFRPRWSL